MNTYLLDEYTEMTDEEVLSRSLEDPQYFAVLVARYKDAFIRSALRVVRNPEDAEEVVQDAFTKMYAAAPRFKKVEGASFKSWGYTIVLNTAKTRYMKMKRERGMRTDLEPEHYESLPDSTPTHEQYEIREDLLVAMAKLPEQFSRILSLQFLEGKSQEEIAESEDLSVGAVKTRVHRAKKALKEIINQQSI